MSYQVNNFLIKQGADFIRQLVFEGVPEGDLSGYTLRSHIRKKYTDTAPLVAFTVAIDGLTATLSLTAIQTAALAPNCFSYQITSDFYTRAINRLPEGYYVYDVELVTPSSLVIPVLEGGVCVLPEATK